MNRLPAGMLGDRPIKAMGWRHSAQGARNLRIALLRETGIGEEF